MATRQVHTILHQVLDVEATTGSRAEQTALANRWSEVAARQLPTLLNRVFDAAAPPDRLLRIDRLEIVLEALPGESPGDVLERELSRQLERALATAAATEAGSAQPEARDADWFFFYLQRGYLPWSAPRRLHPSELEYRLTELLTRRPTIAKELLARVSRDKVALQRLLLRFTPAMPWRLLLAVYPAVEGRWRIAERRRLLDEATPQERLMRWRRLLQQPQTSPQRLAATTADAEPEAPVPAAESLEATDPETPVFLENAGLVLLHPFLPRLLRLVGYAVGDTLVDADRAVHLLHYIATGQHPEAEWSLLLPKLLCGMPTRQVVDPEKGVPPAARAAADEMMASAIAHWAVLKSTSVEGLRTNFLQREGRLTYYPDRCSLRVEQRPYDMLLDHLPWGIGLVRLPWMAAHLVVEWT